MRVKLKKGERTKPTTRAFGTTGRTRDGGERRMKAKSRACGAFTLTSLHLQASVAQADEVRFQLFRVVGPKRRSTWNA
jgi:hypothetical protein